MPNPFEDFLRVAGSLFNPQTTVQIDPLFGGDDGPLGFGACCVARAKQPGLKKEHKRARAVAASSTKPTTW